MAKIVAFSVIAVALLGILLCLGAYVFELAGIYSPSKNHPSILFFGILVVWFPTILLMNKLTQDFKQKDMWKAALRGCPSWIKKSMWGLVGAVVVLGFLPSLLRMQKAYPDVGVLFPIVSTQSHSA